MKKVDLHIHSKFSDDGELSVEKIIDIAKENGVKTISITDHNSVGGVKKAIEYGEKLGVKVISGIEIDCHYNGLNLHLLGYGFDYEAKELSEIEKDVYNQEIEAAKEKIRLIKEKTDFIVDEDWIYENAKKHGGIVTGELIGENIINNIQNHDNPELQPYLKDGNRADMPYVNFYWDYFSQGKLAYVHIDFISLKKAIEIIENNGGVPIIAHPGNNLKNNKELIYDLIDTGIKGIEVYNSYHSKEDTEFYLNVAKENNLLISCGTDFHGKNKPHIKIGKFNNEINFKEIIDKLKN